MTFNEANTVEQLILDAAEQAGWRYVAGPLLKRLPSEVFVEDLLRKALVRLNPEIAAQPDRADEVIYKLRAIPLAVQNDGLVRSNRGQAVCHRDHRGHQGSCSDKNSVLSVASNIPFAFPAGQIGGRS